MPWTRFFRCSRRDDEAAREIASYIAMETDDNIARGLSPQSNLRNLSPQSNLKNPEPV